MSEKSNNTEQAKPINELIQIRRDKLKNLKDMGKASFMDIQDKTGKIQVYLRTNDLGEDVYKGFSNWDIGDVVKIKGFVFKTRRGEISI